MYYNIIIYLMLYNRISACSHMTKKYFLLELELFTAISVIVASWTVFRKEIRNHQSLCQKNQKPLKLFSN